MGRLWNKWLVPALFAVILFLCIRVANDIPKHEYYWESNEWNFMLKDMLVVLFMSYPIFFLLKYWLRLCRKRKLVWWQEYGVVVLTVPVWCLLTMWVIRFLMGVSLDLYDVPVPAIVSMLLGGFFYIFLRNQMCFSIENSIPEPLVHQKGKHGIGIENLRRRLELLYPERHTLDINRGDTLFRVKLVIEL